MRPGDTLIGVLVMGMGVLLAYSAYRNVPMLGANGLLTQAIQKGKLPTVPAPSTGNTQPGTQPGPNPPKGPNPHGTVQ